MKISKLHPDRPTPLLRNKRLRESIEELRLAVLKNAGTRATVKRPKSGAVSTDADLFAGDKKRGTIYFSVCPSSYRATLMPMVGFVHLDGSTQRELVRQIMEWVMREYVGATEIEVRSEKVTTLCQKLNRELRAFCARNERNKVTPEGRTLSQAHMPHQQGDRYARIS